jgi:hypothetical protein
MSVVAVTGTAAVVVFAVSAAVAPAGNRQPTTKIVEFPGPEQVTFGEDVAYTSTLFNGPDQSSSFTHVIYNHRIPTTILDRDANGVEDGIGAPVPAKLVYASCDPGLTNWNPNASDGTYHCPELSQLPAGATARVLLVWQTPGVPDSVGDNVTCDSNPLPASPVNSCTLTSSGYWTIKEGTGNPGSNGPDTYPSLAGDPVVTDLLGSATDLRKARAYALAKCQAGSSSLKTSDVVPVGPGNTIVTKVCSPTVPGQALQPGLVIQIDELGTGTPLGPPKRLWDTVFICAPRPDPDLTNTVDENKCPVTPGYFNAGYQPWPFDDPSTTAVERGRFTFVLENVKGEKLDQVFHNGVLDANDPTFSCTITISNGTKATTTVVCDAADNGGWDFN